MSLEDRERWNQRYEEGSYSDRSHPSPVLEEWRELLPAQGDALDIACGLGRNARFLARENFNVTGVDVSDVALDRARKLARRERLDIRYEWIDLDDGLPLQSRYDVVTIIRFLDRELLQEIHNVLKPGGFVAVEIHLLLDHPRPLAGPRTGRFRLKPGELSELLGTLQPVRQFEGVVVDPDGKEAAVARMLARKAPV